MSNERIRQAQNTPNPSSQEVIVIQDDAVPLRIEVKRPSKAFEDEHTETPEDIPEIIPALNIFPQSQTPSGLYFKVHHSPLK